MKFFKILAIVFLISFKFEPLSLFELKNKYKILKQKAVNSIFLNRYLFSTSYQVKKSICVAECSKTLECMSVVFDSNVGLKKPNCHLLNHTAVS